MQRYFVAMGAMLLVVVSLVAGEGGPLDRFVGSAPASAPAADAGPTVATADAATPASAQVALGGSFGIGDYDVGGAGGADSTADEDYGGYGEPTAPFAPEPMLAANQPSAKWNVPDGSLTDEQLGVERPTGLAPV